MSQPDSPSRKRGTPEEDNEAQSLAEMTRVERKRMREKKRRSDVNKGFEDLTSLLVEIDPSFKNDIEERSNRKLNNSSGDEAVMSRVELITRTGSILRRVHNENEANKEVLRLMLSQQSSVPTETTQVNRSVGSFHSIAPQLLELMAGPQNATQPAILQPAPDRFGALRLLLNQQHVLNGKPSTSSVPASLLGLMTQQSLGPPNRGVPPPQFPAAPASLTALSNDQLLRMLLDGQKTEQP